MNGMNLRASHIKNGFIATLVIGVIVTLGFNCARFEVNEVPSAEEIQNTGDTTEKETAPIGLLSADQIVKAMISATGIEGLGELTDPADDLIDKTFNERSGSLPSVQNLSQVTGPMLIATTNLASAVCAKVVDRDRALGEDHREERLFFRELDFSKGLSSQSSEAVTIAFSRLARNAWRRDPTDEELDMMIAFAQEFTAEANLTSSDQTRLLAVSICTGVLSSIDTLTY